MTISWQFNIDWDNDGSYEADESTRMMDMTIRRGRQFYLKEEGDGFQPFGVGSATVVLDNHDQRYNPYNSSSPLYPNISPDRYARIDVAYYVGVILTARTIFEGKITDIKPVSRDRVRIEMEDGLAWLRDTTTDIVLETNTTADVVIGNILDNVDWPAIYGRNLDSGTDVYDYVWADNVNAKKAINDIVGAGIGTYYVASNGQFVFRSRHYNRSSSKTIDDSELLKEIQIRMPWEYQRNSSKVNVYPLATQNTSTLWTLQENTFIEAGDSATFTVLYKYDNQEVPAINVVTPVANTDYTMNTASDGSGADTTGDFTVSATKYGQTAELVVSNTGGDDSYITLLKIRGDAITSEDVIVAKTDNSGGDQPRLFVLDTPWLQDVNVGISFADFLATEFDNTNKLPIIQVENRPSIQYDIDLNDLVTITSSELGINDDYTIGYIEHVWMDANGQSVKTTFHTEPYIDYGTFWTFPTKIGETSIFAL